MFRTVPLFMITSFSLYTQQWLYRTDLPTACEQDQDGTGSILILLSKPV